MSEPTTVPWSSRVINPPVASIKVEIVKRDRGYVVTVTQGERRISTSVYADGERVPMLSDIGNVLNGGA